MRLGVWLDMYLELQVSMHKTEKDRHAWSCFDLSRRAKTTFIDMLRK